MQMTLSWQLSSESQNPRSSHWHNCCTAPHISHLGWYPETKNARKVTDLERHRDVSDWFLAEDLILITNWLSYWQMPCQIRQFLQLQSLHPVPWLWRACWKCGLGGSCSRVLSCCRCSLRSGPFRSEEDFCSSSSPRWSLLWWQTGLCLWPGKPWRTNDFSDFSNSSWH